MREGAERWEFRTKICCRVWLPEHRRARCPAEALGTNPSPAADSAHSLGQTVQPPRTAAAPWGRARASISQLGSHQQQQGALADQPKFRSSGEWRLLRAKLKGLRSALPRSQEIALSFVSDVMVGNCNKTSSAKAVLGRAAVLSALCTGVVLHGLQ